MNAAAVARSSSGTNAQGIAQAAQAFDQAARASDQASRLLSDAHRTALDYVRRTYQGAGAGSEAGTEVDSRAGAVDGVEGKSHTFSSRELGEAWANSVKTSAGRAYYGSSDDKLRDLAGRVPPLPGVYTVDMHGGPDEVVIGSDELGASALAELVRADNSWGNQPIRLFSCETGRGDDPIAQKLADELEVQVTAPTELVWSDADGDVTVAPAVWKNIGGTWLQVPGADLGPAGWRTFLPRP